MSISERGSFLRKQFHKTVHVTHLKKEKGKVTFVAIASSQLLVTFIMCYWFDLIFFFFFSSKHLKDPHFSVRCQCLCLIGHLNQGLDGGPSKLESEPQVGAQNLLASFAKDSDPRVRTSALQALVSLHSFKLFQIHNRLSINMTLKVQQKNW